MNHHIHIDRTDETFTFATLFTTVQSRDPMTIRRVLQTQTERAAQRGHRLVLHIDSETLAELARDVFYLERAA